MFFKNSLKILAQNLFIVIIEVVGDIASVGKNADTAVPRDVAFLFFLVINGMAGLAWIKLSKK